MSKDLKSNIKSLIKKYHFLYLIYYKIASALLRLLGLFVKADEHLILFVSFGGRRPFMILCGMTGGSLIINSSGAL